VFSLMGFLMSAAISLAGQTEEKKLTTLFVVLPCGYLSDRFGRKPVILLGKGSGRDLALLDV
jgi:MFS family permease